MNDQRTLTVDATPEEATVAFRAVIAGVDGNPPHTRPKLISLQFGAAVRLTAVFVSDVSASNYTYDHKTGRADFVKLMIRYREATLHEIAQHRESSDVR